MRVILLQRHLLAVLLVCVLGVTSIALYPQRATAANTGTTNIAVTVKPGQTMDLAARSMAGLVWTLKEKNTGGRITTQGKLIAPLKPGQYHIIGISKGKPRKTFTFTATVQPIVAVTEPTLGTERLYPLPGGGVIRMRYVPPGAFEMGNSEQGDDAELGQDEEKPKHTVTVSGFWVGKCEVTRGQYRKFMKAGGYTNQDYWSPEGWAWLQDAGRTEPNDWAPDIEWANPPGSFKQTDDHPVVGINHFEAEAFCRWAGLRLPTEAEWEKAARWDGQHSRIYAWGDTWDATKCNDANDPLYPGGQTAPIGKYPGGASPCGALDMIGNVWEWCSDWRVVDYYASSPSTDPQGPPTSDLRVVKGGSWFGSNWVGADENDRLRAALRGGFDPHNTSGQIGFRCAVTKMPASAQ